MPARICLAMLWVSLLAASLSAASGTAGGGALGTSIHLYAPFNGGVIANGIKVEKNARGYCWTSSIADARQNAFRCFVGNYIHDPCFANQTGSSTFVLCPLYLPTSKVLRINLTKHLPTNPARPDPTRYPPWAVQLEDGRWCELFTGATGDVAGMRIAYGCTGGGVLLGSPRRSTATWSIFYAQSATSRQFRTVGIRAAWW